jgi:hypothetical protein
MSRKLFVILGCLFFAGLAVSSSNQSAGAQELETATPARGNFPTLPPPPIQGASTATPTYTPTVPGRAVLEAKPDAGDVNVRAEADIGADKIGTIRAGDQYPILGKYFRWYQFQFDLAPAGRGWVFDELVNIIGDPATIPDLSVEALPTDDPVIVGATQTQLALTQTPGGILTATENSRQLALPGTPAAPSGAEAALSSDNAAPLPTFTFPPDLIAATPVDLSLITPTLSPGFTSISVSEGVPPIVPIVVLGGFGLLGLFVSSLRR